MFPQVTSCNVMVLTEHGTVEQNVLFVGEDVLERAKQFFIDEVKKKDNEELTDAEWDTLFRHGFLHGDEFSVIASCPIISGICNPSILK